MHFDHFKLYLMTIFPKHYSVPVITYFRKQCSFVNSNLVIKTIIKRLRRNGYYLIFYYFILLLQLDCKRKGNHRYFNNYAIRSPLLIEVIGIIANNCNLRFRKRIKCSSVESKSIKVILNLQSAVKFT
jgi:hypothetical protein